MNPDVSLQVSKRADETLWGRAITNIGKVFYASNFNIYTLLISRKRKAVVKAYYNYAHMGDIADINKREIISNKYKKAYSEYINILDKYIKENIYTKMQKKAATFDEERIMSEYYAVTKYKGVDETDYQVRLEILVLKMDWENVQSYKSDVFVQKFRDFYAFVTEENYKTLMRHNSILLANSKKGDRDQYEAIYDIIDKYIKEALPSLHEDEKRSDIIKDYRKYVKAIDSFEKKDFLELRKRLALLGFAGDLFEYSFPKVAQEQCYLEIIEIARIILTNYYTDAEKYAAYEVIMDAIEEYIDNILAYKTYWVSENDKKEYKKLEEKWLVMKKLARIDYDAYLRQREVLFINYDLNTMKKEGINLPELRAYYKERLIIRHAIRKIKNHALLLGGSYIPRRRQKADEISSEATEPVAKVETVEATKDIDALQSIIDNIKNIADEQFNEYKEKIIQSIEEKPIDDDEIVEPESTFNVVDFVMNSTRNLKKRKIKL